MKVFLSYIPGSSFLYRLNPLTKMYLAFIICVCCFLTSSPMILSLFILIDIAIAFIAGKSVGIRSLMLLRGLIKLSIMLFIFQILFIRNGNVLFRITSWLYVTDVGLNNAVRLVLRLIAASLPLATMMSIVIPSDLANAMVKHLHVPYKYAFTFVSAVRFIPILSAEMSNIIEAQMARGMELDTNNFLKKLSLIIPLCMPLLFLSVRKTELAAVAADLRGLKLRTANSCSKLYQINKIDGVVFFVGVFAVFTVITITRVFYL